MMNWKTIACAMFPLMAMQIADAADNLKVGLLSTLSGPSSAIGVDVRDGFTLGVKHRVGKLGGRPAEIIIGDDQQNPDAGKQAAERMLKKDRVDVMTGVIFTNVLLAVFPPAAKANTFYISSVAGPAELAGAGCDPYFFNVSHQNESSSESMGKYLNDKGYRKVYLIAPNYPAGKEASTGFKRFYRAGAVEENFPKFGQLDYAAELAQIRAARPDAVYIFLPGGMGINFIKQYQQAGLGKDTPLFGHSSSFDEDVIRAVGMAAAGAYNGTQWNRDFDNPQSKQFVADFEKEFGRAPSLYAALAYDAAALVDAAVGEVKGRVEDKTAFRKALEKANFKSVRGDFRFNTNHFPIQSFYLRQVVSADGKMGSRTIEKILDGHADPYAPQCRMK